MQASKIRIGTRGSPLALVQAREVQQRLTAAHGLSPDAIEIAIIKTSGDRIQDRPLAEVGGKGLFTKEIEEALIASEIDLAVHSMKDLETMLPAGLAIAAILPREDVRDAFVSVRYRALSELPAGAKVGTSSLRRAAQVRRLRPDLQVVGFRGNVDTRLRKLEQGVVDATLLAVAGLNRLGQSARVTRAMDIAEMLPAVAQGAVGIEVRNGDAAMSELVAAVDHPPSAICIAAERAFLARLDGSCRTPIAGLATIEGSDIVMRGMILSLDGRQVFETARRARQENARDVGAAAADEIIACAGKDFLAGFG